MIFERGVLMKKTITDYRNDLASAEKQLEQATHRINRLEQKLKYRESLSRKERTHRLIVRGAILEQYFPEVKELSEPEISEVFHYIVKEELHQVLKEAIAYVRKEVLG